MTASITDGPYGLLQEAGAIPAFPWYVVSVYLKDANGNPVDGGRTGAATLSFAIVQNLAANNPVYPFPESTGEGAPFAADGQGGEFILNDIKSLFENMSWNFIQYWQDAVPGVTSPVSFDRITITQFDAASTDITPS